MDAAPAHEAMSSGHAPEAPQEALAHASPSTTDAEPLLITSTPSASLQSLWETSNGADSMIAGKTGDGIDPTTLSDPFAPTEEEASVQAVDTNGCIDAEAETAVPKPHSAAIEDTCQRETHATHDQDEAATAEDSDPIAQMRAQLEHELTKRRPDRFVISVICRELGGVPTALRSAIWQELLGVARSERLHLDESISRVAEDLSNQRVIAADAHRTRGQDAYFRQRETMDTIVRLLTFYCKSRNIHYKQGMNEVLAPFMILEREPPLAEGVVFQLYYAFIDRLMPHVFVDREFKSLQCSFQLYRLLMRYHDPMLCSFLDQHAMIPELYVTPWFMTLFARNLAPELVLALWDFFLLQDDPYTLHFVAYALVAEHRQQILQADVCMLPQVLTGIAFADRAQLDHVCHVATHLMETTPRSFSRDLFAVCYGGYNNSMAPFLRQVMGASSLQVYPDELVRNLMSRLGRSASKSSASMVEDVATRPVPMVPSSLVSRRSYSAERHASQSSVFFIVLDCRPIEQFRACHLSLSYHIDPEVVSSPDALSVLIDGFARMKGCHFCFVGPSVASPTASTSTSTGAFGALSKLTRGLTGDRQQPDIATVQSHPHSDHDSEFTGDFRRESDCGVGRDSLTGGAVGLGAPPRLKREHVTITRLVLMFVQKGFEHVSRLDGSFDELKQEIESMDALTKEQLLVIRDSNDIDDDTSLVRNGSGGGSSRGFGGFRLFAKRAFERVRTNSEDDARVETATSPGELATDLSVPSSGSPTPTPTLTPSASSATLQPVAQAQAQPQSQFPTVKTKKTAVSTLSQRLQSLTSAAKDVVAPSRIPPRASLRMLDEEGTDSGAVPEERRLVGEDEWMEVCVRTQEALDKSQCVKEVVFQSGTMGILFQRSRHKRYHTVVESIVEESQADESQQIAAGDLLLSMNGQDLSGVSFPEVIAMVKNASRPVSLRFQNLTLQRKRSVAADTAMNAISIPPLPPILISASHHSVCMTWNKPWNLDTSAENNTTLYQLQYAEQSDHTFHPWMCVPMKQENTSERDLSGISTCSSGTMVGLDPGMTLVFRVRCGNGDSWGPYSLSSAPMSTLEKEGQDGDGDGSDDAKNPDDTTIPLAAAISPRSLLRRQSVETSAVFLPGECPEFFERGTYYYRVIVALHARTTPALDGEKIDDVVLERGAIIKCCERLVAPRTNQVFVRLSADWNVEERCRQRAIDSTRNESNVGIDDDGTDGVGGNEDDSKMSSLDEYDAWAFENTPDGGAVLERLPEFSEDEMVTALQTTPTTGTALHEHAKSLMSSLFSGSRIRSNSSFVESGGVSADSTPSPPVSLSTSETLVASSTSMPIMVPCNVTTLVSLPTEVIVSWDPINDPTITRYQLQFARNRLTSTWTTAKQDMDGDTSRCCVTDLAPNATYVFRVRGGNDQLWFPFSDSSDVCKTVVSLEGDQNDGSTSPPDAGSRANPGDQDESSTDGWRARGNSDSSSDHVHSPQPLRTGSTFLDKAVAAASRLSFASRNRSVTESVLTLTDDESSSADGMFSDVATEMPVEGDLIDAVAWKSEIAMREPGGRSFVAIRYIATSTVKALETVATDDTSSDHQSSSDGGDQEGTLNDFQDEKGDGNGVVATPVLTWTRVGERELVVTASSIVALARPSSSETNDALVETCRPLAALTKITSKKSVINSVVFHFHKSDIDSDICGDQDDTCELEQICFVVENKEACVALVKRRYQACHG